MEEADDLRNIFVSENDIIDSLSEEIKDFEEECAKEYAQTLNDTSSFMDRLRKLVAEESLTVEQYGSFATGLWLKHCDIDLLLVPKEDPYEVSNTLVDDYLDRVYLLLKRSSLCKNVQINKKVRVPMIRAEIGVDNSSKTRKVDMTVLDRSHNGRTIAQFVSEQLGNFPQLRPMFFAIKTLSYSFRLNDPKNGGIRTYAIIVMLLSRISSWNECKLGKLLLDFLYYFGFYYDYSFEYRGEGENDCRPLDFEEERMVLKILDPLNTNNNIGTTDVIVREERQRAGAAEDVQGGLHQPVLEREGLPTGTDVRHEEDPGAQLNELGRLQH